MTIATIVCVGNEKETVSDRSDPYGDALESYSDLADHVVVVDGSEGAMSINAEGLRNNRWKYYSYSVIPYSWPYEWSFEELPKHLNKGLDGVKEDWVIRCDIDYVFHEDELDLIREELEKNKDRPVVTLQKYVFTTHDKYLEKGALPVAINRKLVGDTYKFGYATNQDTDLCYPIRVTGFNEKWGIPEGVYEPDRFGRSRAHVYVYDRTFQTKEFLKKEFFRLSRAYHKFSGKWSWGRTEREAFDIFMDMVIERRKRAPYTAKVSDHPKYIRAKIQKLTKDQLGYSLFGSVSDDGLLDR